MSSDTAAKKQQKPSFIARKFLSMNEEQAKIMPPDSWIVRTAWQATGEVKGMRRTLGVIGACALTALGLAVAAVVLPFVSIPAVTAAVGATGMYAAGAGAGAIALGLFAKKKADTIKDRFFPDLKKIIGMKFVKYKGDQMMDAFRANLAKNKKTKTPKAEKPATPEASVTEQPKAKVEESKKADTAPKTSGAAKTPEKKGWVGGFLGKAFGGGDDKKPANDSRKPASDRKQGGGKPGGPSA